MHELSRDEARRLVVRAQLLDAQRPGDVVEVAEQLTAIKIDPTATIATSEHAIAWSRIGWSYEPGQLRKAVEQDHLLFEYAGRFHAGSLLAARVAQMRARELRAEAAEWLEANARFRAEVLAALRAEGPLLAGQIADTSQVAARSESGWYGPNQVPRMLELLSHLGEVAVVGREGRQRRWDVAERAFPADLEILDADDAERILAMRRLQAAGIARARSAWTPVGQAGEEVRVAGSTWRWRVDPEALTALDDDPGGRVAILNPYDPILFDRPRLKGLFDFPFVLEQFVPKHKRVYGYFVYPILVADRFIGLLDARLDPPRETLVVSALHELAPWEDEERDAVRAELDELAEWLGVSLRLEGGEE